MNLMRWEDKRRLSIMLCVFGIAAFLILALTSCAGELTLQPKFYSPTEKHIMYIPKGCKIGDTVAPEDGIFIGRSRILDMRIVEVPEEAPKQKKKRT